MSRHGQLSFQVLEVSRRRIKLFWNFVGRTFYGFDAGLPWQIERQEGYPRAYFSQHSRDSMSRFIFIYSCRQVKLLGALQIHIYREKIKCQRLGAMCDAAKDWHERFAVPFKIWYGGGAGKIAPPRLQRKYC